MNATFTSTGPMTFTRSVTFVAVPPATGAPCQVKGTYGKRVKLHLRCVDGSTTLRAHLNPTAETLSAPVHLWVRGHGRHRAQFTLTKN
jgi:hypothetical protein